jgi:hypothetical protein
VDGTGGGRQADEAARLVLGRDLGAGVRRDELRSAFRRRALELHPDRAAALGRDTAELAHQFRALCTAYDLLEGLVEARRGFQPPRVARTRREDRAPRTAPAAGLPPRPLRFAEYLYYAGRISWADLAEAIAWQRHAGRRIGEWFVERGLIHAGEVRSVREALARHNAASQSRAG